MNRLLTEFQCSQKITFDEKLKDSEEIGSFVSFDGPETKKFAGESFVSQLTNLELVSVLTLSYFAREYKEFLRFYRVLRNASCIFFPVQCSVHRS